MYNRSFGSKLAKLWRSTPVTQVQKPETRRNEANTPTRKIPDVRPPNVDTAAQFVTLALRLLDLVTQYQVFRNLNDLNMAIVVLRQMLSLYPPGDPARSSPLEDLAVLLTSRYQRLEGVDDLNEIIILRREALSLRPPGHPDRPSSLETLANLLSSWCHQLKGIDYLNEAIILSREALSLRPPGHPCRSASLYYLGYQLSDRFRRQGKIDDLNEAIVFSREALSLRPPGHPDHSQSLRNLGIQLSNRFHQLGEIDDLNGSIALTRESLSLCPPGHPDRSAALNGLGGCLSYRYRELGGIDDLNEVIVLALEALSLRPPGHPRRSESLNNLAGHLFYRYWKLGGMDDLDDLNEAIVLSREALSLCSPGHPIRSVSLNNLGRQLSIRFRQLGEIDDMNEAIEFNREALSLQPPGHPDRSLSLNNLGSQLSDRFQQLGKIDDLNEAVELVREALSLCPPGHTTRSMSLGNLAARLSSRYEQLGGIGDLNEAIVLGREALSLRLPGHIDRAESLSSLGCCLSSRYKRLGGIDDLNEAIVLIHEALSLDPPGHPHRSGCLSNLASHLSYRYNHLGGIDDLSEAIVLSRKALSLHLPGHLHHAQSLNDLGYRLIDRFERLREIDDLKEAIVLMREALSLYPPEHPDRSTVLHNLGRGIYYRYMQLGGIDDLKEALAVYREALSLRSPGHPSRSLYLRSLAICISSWYKDPRGVDDAIEDRHALFALFAELEHVSQTVSTNDLLAARAWVVTAEEFHHSTTLSAYETALRLLVEYSAALPPLPQHLALLKSLSSSLAVDAFSACLRDESPTHAVELLEQGRAVFWSQLTRLRSPLESVIESGPQGKALAEEFTRLTSLVRYTLSSPDPDQHDRVCRLNLELQKVVSKIRESPGLSRFLLPSLFVDLRRAAGDGPVIIMNASKYGCDALVVFADKDPVHIPLPVMKEDVRKLSLRLRTLTKDAKRMNMDDNFKVFLRELWDQLVSHIVDVLRTTCPFNSRIWWCPTAEFSLLPLHAASPYRQGQKGLPDLYASSYTTTLSALIHARRPSALHCTGEKNFLAVGQATAKDAKPLLHVGPELDIIGQLVGGLTTFTRCEGKDACISNVADALGKNEWVHFACHGIPSQKTPFESGFALLDGRFTIQHMTQCNFQNSEFAYLSACQTTVGDKESPDEVIHLAAAMQFAGFRSVIGTMWEVDDSETNKVISKYYELMIDPKLGRLDYMHAARVLRMTMKKVEIPMDQRILYIHLGV